MSEEVAETLSREYLHRREQSSALCEGLTAEDMTAQSMEDASPIKWHLAHTTWFFETFILLKTNSYKAINPQFQYLFNSYYESVGDPYARPKRGLITRPGVDEVLEYRRAVDTAILQVIESDYKAFAEVIEIGLHHEMQHQELMLTDLLHLFAQNPLFPAAMQVENESQLSEAPTEMRWLTFDAAMVEVGHDNLGFSYDCERPRHKTYLSPYALASRPVTNIEWLEFMEDGGYENSLLWLSEGWACIKEKQWQAPAYWLKQEGQWQQFGLDGLKPISPAAPVSHISYFEAQAYAMWAGKRLPREHELEVNSEGLEIGGNFVEQKLLRPQPLGTSSSMSVQQLYGDVWEWTQSAYLPYPKFKAENGALGEYNGKFMSGQFVLRGGSCATPQKQMRSSYRNFFYPHQRWQFTGLRLAQDQ